MDYSMFFEERKFLYNLHPKINGFVGSLNYARFALFGESHRRVPFINRVFSTKIAGYWPSVYFARGVIVD